MPFVMPPIHIVETPINTIHNFVDSNTYQIQKRGENIAQSWLKDLLKILNEAVLSMHQDIIQCSKEDAQNLLKQLEPSLEYRATIDRTLQSEAIEAETRQAKEILQLVKNLWNNTFTLVDDIIIIANQEEVEETSEEYKSFMSKLTDEGKKTEIVYGKAALLNLFED